MNDVLVCHPDVMSVLRSSLLQSGVFADAPSWAALRLNPYAPKYKQRWVFPEERFIEYEAKDEAWAIPLGFGWWADDVEVGPVVWSFKNPEYAIPELDWAEFDPGEMMKFRTQASESIYRRITLGILYGAGV